LAGEHRAPYAGEFPEQFCDCRLHAQNMSDNLSDVND
jgi:hypothetical protein